MPHLIVEYTANLAPAADIRGLLRKANQVLVAQGVFPTGGIRARAIRLEEWVVADDADDYAFVHATLKIGAGRAPEVRQKVGDELFAAITAHFAEIYRSRPLALSLELAEFSEAGTWKQNNIHARFK